MTPLKFPRKAYNALFTQMGRKALRYFFKKKIAKLNRNYQATGAFTYSLKNHTRFILHKGNNLSELIYLERAYEPLETLIVSKLVQDGDVVFDLGANVGYFTALLDGHAKPNGQVHAYEPGPETFAKLEQTKKLLKLDRSTLYPLAVGDRVGLVDFYTSTSGSDAQQSTVMVAALGVQAIQKKVQITTLDTILTELNQKGVREVSFVKCDIEGAEISMINGAKNLITATNPPVWMIEHNRVALREHDNSSMDLVSSFANYEIYYVPLAWPPSKMLVKQAIKWNGKPEELPDECNLIIIPKIGIFSKRAVKLRSEGLIP